MIDKESDKMLKKIKNNSFAVIATGVFLIFEYLICSRVYMMGDDYMYGTFAKEGIFKSVWDYYFTGNGRWIVNIFDSLLLKFDRYLFIVVTPLLLLLFAYLIYNVAVQITEKKNNNVFIVPLLAVATMDIMLTRETVYWITGMSNFLLPAILFLAAVYTSLYLVKNEDCSKGKKVFCGIVCIIASATMEQFALMTVGWLFLLFGYKIWERKKFKKAEFIIFILAVIALASVVLAPGNFVRVNKAAESSQTLMIKIFDLFYNNFHSVVAAKFVIPLLFIEGIIMLKENKKIGYLTIISTVIFLLLTAFEKLDSFMIVVFLFIVFMVVSVIVLVISKKNLNLFHIIAFVFLAVGSQIMLLVSEIWGFRTTFSVNTVFIILTVIFCLYISDDKKWLLPMVCIYAFYANIYFGIACTIITAIILLMKQKKVGEVLKCAIVLVTIAWSLKSVGLGFGSNVEIHKFNEEQAKSVTENNTQIEMKPYNDEIYGWTTPPLSDFHSEYFKRYYGIPQDVELVCANKQN